MYAALLADAVTPIPSSPVTIGPGAWLSIASNLGGLVIAMVTLLTTGRRWLGARVAEAATIAVEANVLPKLNELTVTIDRINSRLDEAAQAVRSTAQRIDDVVARVDAHGRRLDEYALRLDNRPRTPRRTTQ